MSGERLFELRRRTFNTPHFRGITFIEVEAKSILNHVPGSYLPFNWTINPYRGCSHACSYCMSGDTPILMADGRSKRLADVRAGDEIYGTEMRGRYRRYVRTQVLDHWSTVKRGCRVALEDGTELVASLDHRFLSDRGWKYVTGAEQGRSRRPHLTLNNALMGTGRFAGGPEQGADYRRGYLCGLIRGDGHIGSYSYQRPGRTLAKVHRFRLALVDIEALRRARDYLLQLGLPTQEFVFQQAAGARRRLNAIRTSTHDAISAIQEVMRWPEVSSNEWCKGFLAGIFDAEGSYSSGILRIANTDQAIVEQLTVCLRRLGFYFTEDGTDHPNGLGYVRLLGGLREHLRFFTPSIRQSPARGRSKAAPSRTPAHVSSRSILSASNFPCTTSPRERAISSPTAS